MSTAIKVLLIEDNKAEARLLHEFLQASQSKQFSLVHVTRLKEALTQLEESCFDIILLDLTLPDSQGLDSLTPLKDLAPSLPIVVLTNTNDEELAIEAVRQGAQDYLVKRQVNNTEVLVRSLVYAIERKQVAEQLRSANQTLQGKVIEETAQLVKAKEVNQQTSAFVSMFSHDFRNPLTAILLSTGLLQDHEHELSQETKSNQYQLIRAAIFNMDRLLEEVLLIGKADVGKLECNLESLNLESLCRRIVAETQPFLSPSHQLIFTSTGELTVGLWDQSLLQHILTNLLSNALKYSPSGGTVHFDLTFQAKTVTFQIKDSGIGIPKSDFLKLFQPFHRAENTDKIPGTGLGLAIVKKCVEVYGGQISVQSEIGIGSVFTAILPLQNFSND
ncbi:hybrid sensor histidine kinase/response regulator [Synechocystis sp. PCC 7509]|uniref:hybrid sensor histidine kinase/response regulator n=1 Tax=Synechocystis sp. PCC 7509 TaxID=927677 RepID=UPI0002F089B6|nr:hybrid sensor histidine kinase/response regulator [Synechocystis sp. PCC 7509]